MISDLPELDGADVTVMGLGLHGGGTGVTRFLRDRGARVTVTDLKPPEELQESLDDLSDLDVEYTLGEHREDDFTSADLILVNPAVPLDSPYLQAAREQNVPLESELNLFVKLCPSRIIGITGSAGKSTTTALTGRMLEEEDDVTSWTGGNIGRSLLTDVERMTAEDWVVLEISSFQLLHLDEINWSPAVAVVTNISPNHLDRHGNYEAYKQAKKTIVRYQQSDDLAVLNEEDETLSSWKRDVKATIQTFSTDRSVNAGAWVKQDRILFRPTVDAPDETLLHTDDIPIPGSFNVENVLAALCAARRAGASTKAIQTGVRTFEPLPHHLEEVGEGEHVTFIDDSVSTTPESTMAALSALDDRRIVVILGGYDKGSSVHELVRKVCQSTRGAVLIGDTAEKFERAFQNEDPSFPRQTTGELRSAVQQACNLLPEEGGTVLLSTASASYDMFRNYQERGNQFQEIVREEFSDQ